MFSRSRIKIVSATLVLVTIMAGSMVFVISSHRSEAANMVLNDLPEETSVQEVDSLTDYHSDHRVPQLRSYREHNVNDRYITCSTSHHYFVETSSKIYSWSHEYFYKKRRSRVISTAAYPRGSICSPSHSSVFCR